MQIDHSKNSKWQWTIVYLIKRGFLSLLGPSRTLKIFLRAHWLLRRVTYEVAGIKYGDKFQNLALGLSDELLNIRSCDRLSVC